MIRGTLRRLNRNLYQTVVQRYTRTHRQFKLRALDSNEMGVAWSVPNYAGYRQDMALYNEAMRSYERDFLFIHRLLGGHTDGEIRREAGYNV
jgi:hypothetical protein